MFELLIITSLHNVTDTALDQGRCTRDKVNQIILIG